MQSLTMDQILWCAQNCERQQSGEMSVYKMCDTLALMRQRRALYGSAILDHTMISEIAYRIAPRNGGTYRDTYVTRSGEIRIIGVDPRKIPDAMETLLVAYSNPMFEMTAIEFTREFLEIHPFIDGNGRSSAIIYNYINDTLDEPVDHPDYYVRDTDAR